MTQEDILDQYPDSTFLFADGLDDAIIGVDGETMRVIYSVAACIDIFTEQGMSMDEAIEYFDFNIRGSYMGEKTPIWCDDMF